MVNFSGLIKTGTKAAVKSEIKMGAKVAVTASIKASAVKLAKETVPALIKKNPKLVAGLTATAGYAAYTGYKWSKNNDTNYDIVAASVSADGLRVKFSPANADIGVGGEVTITGSNPLLNNQVFKISKVIAADEIQCSGVNISVGTSAGPGGVMNYKCDVETQFNKQVSNGVSSVAGSVNESMGALFGNLGFDWDQIKKYFYFFLALIVVVFVVVFSSRYVVPLLRRPEAAATS